MNGLGDWGSTLTTLSTVAQTGANTYATIQNAKPVNTSSNVTTIEKYIDKPIVEKKDNTVVYVAVAGVGLLVVGGIIYAVTRKKKG